MRSLQRVIVCPKVESVSCHIELVDMRKTEVDSAFSSDNYRELEMTESDRVLYRTINGCAS